MSLNLYNEAKKSVFFIYSLDDDLKISPRGTGFFLQYNIESKPSKAVGYMVTAKHVLLDDNNNFIKKFVIRMKSKSQEREFILMDLGKFTYFIHDDPNVDIILIPHYPKIELIDFRFIKGEMVLDEQLRGLEEGNEVFFPGLFVQYPGQKQIQPILRFGRLSMIPVEKIKLEIKDKLLETHFYLIECTSYSGNSGSPVFIKEYGQQIHRIDLAGLITGSYNHFETLPYDTILKQNTGIAAVTPSYKLLELLKSPRVFEDRQNHPE